MKKIEKLNIYIGEQHEFIPSDAREICQYCGDWEDEHYKTQEIIINKINEIIEFLGSKGNK